MDLSLTTILIGITALSSIVAFNRPALLDRWMFIPYRIKQRNQWDRFILSGFIHKDYMHLFFNMFTFYFFGGVVERFFTYQFGLELGGLIFLGFYLVAIVVADIPTYLKEQHNSYYQALGASGGIFRHRFCKHHPSAPFGHLPIWDTLSSWLPFGWLFSDLFLCQGATRTGQHQP